MTQLPDYVERHSRLLARGPYIQKGTKLHSFIVSGDIDKLRQVCDLWFNNPSGGEVRYVPWTGKVFVSFADMASVQSGDPEDHYRGKVAEKDVTVWLLLRRTKPWALLPRWFPIHLFVDSAPALITGREIFGFPKEIGHVQFPSESRGDTEFVCRTFGFANESDPDQFGEWLEILRARPKKSSSPRGAEAKFASLDELFGFARQEVLEMWGPGPMEMAGVVPTRFEPSLGLLQSLWPSGLVRMVFLKQFPDAQDNTKAVYQAILETSADVTDFRGAGLTGSWEFDCKSLGSHPLADELGVRPGFQDCGPALWVDFDFVVQQAEVIWQA